MQQKSFKVWVKIFWISVPLRIRCKASSRLLVLAEIPPLANKKFKHLVDHRDELIRYYKATAKGLDMDKVIEGVDHLVNPLDNAINEKCSRIKKAFLDLMDEYTASHYIISSHAAKVVAHSSRIWYQRLKVISLPRHLVVMEGENG